MTERRDRQREALVLAAERMIAARGLAGLKARDLAGEIGCALGAIYNLVQDMDELVLRVSSRTLARLDATLGAAAEAVSATAETNVTKPAATEQLVAVALAYCSFARDNLQLWRTLFEHRLAAGSVLPDWALAEQITPFRHVLVPLRTLAAPMSEADRIVLSRTLFSAVHGVVVIGLEEKLVAVPGAELDRQIATLVRLVCGGLSTSG